MEGERPCEPYVGPARNGSGGSSPSRGCGSGNTANPPETGSGIVGFMETTREQRQTRAVLSSALS